VNDRAMNIKMPSELYEKLQEEAKRKNISLASLVRMICSEYFDQ
jgi:predicted DNA-binding protein